MQVKETFKNPKVRMLLSGATVATKIILTPLLGPGLASDVLDAGVNLSYNLVGSILHDKAGGNSPFEKIIDDRQIERAIHKAISAVLFEQSVTHANRNYEDKLIELSRVEFKVWEDFLKYPVYEDYETLSEKRVLAEIDQNSFKELLYFVDEKQDVNPLIEEKEWYEFLTYLEKQTGIELIASVKERVATMLEEDFLTYLKKAVSEDQQLVNLILLRYLPKLFENQQISISILQNIPQRVLEILEQRGNVASINAGVSFDLPPLTNFFTGRKNVLKNLHATLNDHKLASLHGMFGIGKTTVALKYAYEYQGDYSAVIFIRATEAELLQQMASKAESFDKMRVDALEKLEDKARFFRSYLDDPANWSRRGKKYLLLLDNVDNVEQIKPLVPSNKQGHVIFTANDVNITGFGHEVEISEIENNDGELLLFRRASSSSQLSYKDIPEKDHRHLGEIVLGLGRSPLAINIAGAYIYSTKSSWDSYLELIKTKAILGEGDPTDPYQNKSILKAFEVSYLATCAPDENTKDSELIADSAMHMIHGSVFISPNEIPEEFLQTYVLKQGERFQKVINDIYLWSKAREKALQFDLLRYDRKRNMYWSHRLIQMNIEELLGE